MEQRANIKFCFKLGKTFTQTYESMKKVYGDDCLSRSQIHSWYGRFRDGRDDLNDDSRPGRPVTASTDELVEKVRGLIAFDSNLTCRMLAAEFKVSKDTIHTIMTEKLNRRKVCARFVPHKLTDEQDLARVEHSKDLIETAKINPKFLDSIVTGDETWCFKEDPETHRQSATAPKAKKLRVEKSRMKTMLICFYDSKGIVYQEFVPDGQTVTGEYYLGVMDRLWESLLQIRPEYRAPGSWLLLLDDTPTRKTVAVRKFLAKKQIPVIQHPAYSPDLSPCNYYLFPKIKSTIKGAMYEDIEDIKTAVTSFINTIEKPALQKSMRELIGRAQRCIDAKGAYLE